MVHSGWVADSPVEAATRIVDNVHLLFYRDSIEKEAGSKPPYLLSSSKVDHLHSGGAREAAWTNQFVVKSYLQRIDTHLGLGGCNAWTIRRLRTYGVDDLDICTTNDGKWHSAALWWYFECENG